MKEGEGGGAVVAWWQGVMTYLHPALLWYWIVGPHSWIYRIYRNIKSGFDPRFRRRRRLLSWMGQASGRDVADLASVWQDGTILCAVIHRSCRSACQGHEESQVQDTFRHAQALAYRCLLLQPAFSEAELCRTDLTPNIEKRLFRYLQSLRQEISKRQLNRSVEEESEGEAHIAEEYIARGVGLIMASRNQRAIFYVYSRDGSSLMDIHIEIRGPGDDFGSILVTESESYDNPSGSSIPVEYRLTEEYLRVSYQPRSVGHHELSISHHGYNVPGSPFIVSVDEISEKIPRKRFNSVEWFTEDEERRQKDLQEKKNKAKVKYRIVDFVTEKMYLTDDGTLLSVPPEEDPSITPPPPNFPAPIPPSTPEIPLLTPPSPISSNDSRSPGKKRRTFSPRPRRKRAEKTKWTNIKPEQFKYIIVKPQKAELKRVSDAAAQVALEFQPSMFQERCKRIVTVCDYLLKHCPRQTSLEIISGAGSILQSLQSEKEITQSNTTKRCLTVSETESDDVFFPATCQPPTTVRTVTYPERCRSVSLSHVNDELNEVQIQDKPINSHVDVGGRKESDSSVARVASEARKSFRIEGNTKSPGRRTSFSSIHQVSKSISQTKSTEDSYDLLTVIDDHIFYNEPNNDYESNDSEIKLVNYRQFNNVSCPLDIEETYDNFDTTFSKQSNELDDLVDVISTTIFKMIDITSNNMNTTINDNLNNLSEEERYSKGMAGKTIVPKGNHVGKIISKFETNLSLENDRESSPIISTEPLREIEKSEAKNNCEQYFSKSSEFDSEVSTNTINVSLDNDNKLQIEYLKSIGAPLSTIRDKIKLFENCSDKEHNRNSTPIAGAETNILTTSNIINCSDQLSEATDSEVTRIFRAEPAMVVSKHYAELQEISVNTEPVVEAIVFDFQPKQSPRKPHRLLPLADKIVFKETLCESEYKLDTWDPGIPQENNHQESISLFQYPLHRNYCISNVDQICTQSDSQNQLNIIEDRTDKNKLSQTDPGTNIGIDLNLEDMKTESKLTDAQELTLNQMRIKDSTPSESLEFPKPLIVPISNPVLLQVNSKNTTEIEQSNSTGMENSNQNEFLVKVANVNQQDFSDAFRFPDHNGERVMDVSLPQNNPSIKIIKDCDNISESSKDNVKPDDSEAEPPKKTCGPQCTYNIFIGKQELCIQKNAKEKVFKVPEDKRKDSVNAECASANQNFKVGNLANEINQVRITCHDEAPKPLEINSEDPHINKFPTVNDGKISADEEIEKLILETTTANLDSHNKEKHNFPVSGLTQKLVKVFENIYDKPPSTDLNEGKTYDLTATEVCVTSASIEDSTSLNKSSSDCSSLIISKNKTTQVELTGLTRKLVYLFENIYEPVNTAYESNLTENLPNITEDQQTQLINYEESPKQFNQPDEKNISVDSPTSSSFSGLTKRLVEVFDAQQSSEMYNYGLIQQNVDGFKNKSSLPSRFNSRVYGKKCDSEEFNHKPKENVLDLNSNHNHSEEYGEINTNFESIVDKIENTSNKGNTITDYVDQNYTIGYAATESNSFEQSVGEVQDVPGEAHAATLSHEKDNTTDSKVTENVCKPTVVEIINLSDKANIENVGKFQKSTDDDCVISVSLKPDDPTASTVCELTVVEAQNDTDKAIKLSVSLKPNETICEQTVGEIQDETEEDFALSGSLKPDDPTKSPVCDLTVDEEQKEADKTCALSSSLKKVDTTATTEIGINHCEQTDDVIQNTTEQDFPLYVSLKTNDTGDSTVQELMVVDDDATIILEINNCEPTMGMIQNATDKACAISASRKQGDTTDNPVMESMLCEQTVGEIQDATEGDFALSVSLKPDDKTDSIACDLMVVEERNKADKTCALFGPLKQDDASDNIVIESTICEQQIGDVPNDSKKSSALPVSFKQNDTTPSTDIEINACEQTVGEIQDATEEDSALSGSLKPDDTTKSTVCDLTVVKEQIEADKTCALSGHLKQDDATDNIVIESTLSVSLKQNDTTPTTEKEINACEQTVGEIQDATEEDSALSGSLKPDDTTKSTVCDLTVVEQQKEVDKTCALSGSHNQDDTIDSNLCELTVVEAQNGTDKPINLSVSLNPNDTICEQSEGEIQDDTEEDFALSGSLKPDDTTKSTVCDLTVVEEQMEADKTSALSGPLKQDDATDNIVRESSICEQQIGEVSNDSNKSYVLSVSLKQNDTTPTTEIEINACEQTVGEIQNATEEDSALSGSLKPDDTTKSTVCDLTVVKEQIEADKTCALSGPLKQDDAMDNIVKESSICEQQIGEAPNDSNKSYVLSVSLKQNDTTPTTEIEINACEQTVGEFQDATEDDPALSGSLKPDDTTKSTVCDLTVVKEQIEADKTCALSGHLKQDDATDNIVIESTLSVSLKQNYTTPTTEIEINACEQTVGEIQDATEEDFALSGSLKPDDTTKSTVCDLTVVKEQIEADKTCALSGPLKQDDATDNIVKESSICEQQIGEAPNDSNKSYVLSVSLKQNDTTPTTEIEINACEQTVGEIQDATEEDSALSGSLKPDDTTKSTVCDLTVVEQQKEVDKTCALSGSHNQDDTIDSNICELTVVEAQNGTDKPINLSVSLNPNDTICEQSEGEIQEATEEDFALSGSLKPDDTTKSTVCDLTVVEEQMEADKTSALSGPPKQDDATDNIVKESSICEQQIGEVPNDSNKSSVLYISLKQIDITPTREIEINVCEQTVGEIQDATEEDFALSGSLKPDDTTKSTVCDLMVVKEQIATDKTCALPGPLKQDDATDNIVIENTNCEQQIGEVPNDSNKSYALSVSLKQNDTTPTTEIEINVCEQTVGEIQNATEKDFALSDSLKPDDTTKSTVCDLTVVEEQKVADNTCALSGSLKQDYTTENIVIESTICTADSVACDLMVFEEPNATDKTCALPGHLKQDDATDNIVMESTSCEQQIGEAPNDSNKSYVLSVSLKQNDTTPTTEIEINACEQTVGEFQDATEDDSALSGSLKPDDTTKSNVCDLTVVKDQIETDKTCALSGHFKQDDATDNIVIESTLSVSLKQNDTTPTTEIEINACEQTVGEIQDATEEDSALSGSLKPDDTTKSTVCDLTVVKEQIEADKTCALSGHLKQDDATDNIVIESTLSVSLKQNDTTPTTEKEINACEKTVGEIQDATEEDFALSGFLKPDDTTKSTVCDLTVVKEQIEADKTCAFSGHLKQDDATDNIVIENTLSVSLKQNDTTPTTEIEINVCEQTVGEIQDATEKDFALYYSLKPDDTTKSTVCDLTVVEKQKEADKACALSGSPKQDYTTDNIVIESTICTADSVACDIMVVEEQNATDKTCALPGPIKQDDATDNIVIENTICTADSVACDLMVVKEQIATDKTCALPGPLKQDDATDNIVIENTNCEQQIGEVPNDSNKSYALSVSLKQNDTTPTTEIEINACEQTVGEIQDATEEDSALSGSLKPDDTTKSTVCDLTVVEEQIEADKTCALSGHLKQDGATDNIVIESTLSVSLKQNDTTPTTEIEINACEKTVGEIQDATEEDFALSGSLKPDDKTKSTVCDLTVVEEQKEADKTCALSGPLKQDDASDNIVIYSTLSISLKQNDTTPTTEIEIKTCEQTVGEILDATGEDSALSGSLKPDDTTKSTVCDLTVVKEQIEADKTCAFSGHLKQDDATDNIVIESNLSVSLKQNDTTPTTEIEINVCEQTVGEIQNATEKDFALSDSLKPDDTTKSTVCNLTVVEEQKEADKTCALSGSLKQDDTTDNIVIESTICTADSVACDIKVVEEQIEADKTCALPGPLKQDDATDNIVIESTICTADSVACDLMVVDEQNVTDKTCALPGPLKQDDTTDNIVIENTSCEQQISEVPNDSNKSYALSVSLKQNDTTPTTEIEINACEQTVGEIQDATEEDSALSGSLKPDDTTKSTVCDLTVVEEQIEADKTCALSGHLKQEGATDNIVIESTLSVSLKQNVTTPTTEIEINAFEQTFNGIQDATEEDFALSDSLKPGDTTKSTVCDLTVVERQKDVDKTCALSGSLKQDDTTDGTVCELTVVEAQNDTDKAINLSVSLNPNDTISEQSEGEIQDAIEEDFALSDSLKPDDTTKSTVCDLTVVEQRKEVDKTCALSGSHNQDDTIDSNICELTVVEAQNGTDKPINLSVSLNPIDTISEQSEGEIQDATEEEFALSDSLKPDDTTKSTVCDLTVVEEQKKADKPCSLSGPLKQDDASDNIVIESTLSVPLKQIDTTPTTEIEINVCEQTVGEIQDASEEDFALSDSLKPDDTTKSTVCDLTVVEEQKDADKTCALSGSLKQDYTTDNILIESTICTADSVACDLMVVEEQNATDKTCVLPGPLKQDDATDNIAIENTSWEQKIGEAPNDSNKSNVLSVSLKQNDTTPTTEIEINACEQTVGEIQDATEEDSALSGSLKPDDTTKSTVCDLTVVEEQIKADKTCALSGHLKQDDATDNIVIESTLSVSLKQNDTTPTTEIEINACEQTVGEIQDAIELDFALSDSLKPDDPTKSTVCDLTVVEQQKEADKTCALYGPLNQDDATDNIVIEPTICKQQIGEVPNDSNKSSALSVSLTQNDTTPTTEIEINACEQTVGEIQDATEEDFSLSDSLKPDYTTKSTVCDLTVVEQQKEVEKTCALSGSLKQDDTTDGTVCELTVVEAQNDTDKAINLSVSLNPDDISENNVVECSVFEHTVSEIKKATNEECALFVSIKPDNTTDSTVCEQNVTDKAFTLSTSLKPDERTDIKILGCIVREPKVVEIQNSTDKVCALSVTHKSDDKTDIIVLENTAFELLVGEVQYTTVKDCSFPLSLNPDDTTAYTVSENSVCESTVFYIQNASVEDCAVPITLKQVEITADSVLKPTVDEVQNATDENCALALSLKQDDTTANTISESSVSESILGETQIALNEECGISAPHNKDSTTANTVIDITETVAASDKDCGSSASLKQDGITANTVVEGAVCEAIVVEVHNSIGEACALSFSPKADDTTANTALEIGNSTDKECAFSLSLKQDDDTTAITVIENTFEPKGEINNGTFEACGLSVSLRHDDTTACTVIEGTLCEETVVGVQNSISEAYALSDSLKPDDTTGNNIIESTLCEPTVVDIQKSTVKDGALFISLEQGDSIGNTVIESTVCEPIVVEVQNATDEALCLNVSLKHGDKIGNTVMKSTLCDPTVGGIQNATDEACALTAPLGGDGTNNNSISKNIDCETTINYLRTASDEGKIEAASLVQEAMFNDTSIKRIVCEQSINDILGVSDIENLKAVVVRQDDTTNKFVTQNIVREESVVDVVCGKDSGEETSIGQDKAAGAFVIDHINCKQTLNELVNSKCSEGVNGDELKHISFETNVEKISLGQNATTDKFICENPQCEEHVIDAINFPCAENIEASHLAHDDTLESFVCKQTDLEFINISGEAKCESVTVGQDHMANTAIESIVCKQSVNELENVYGEANFEVVSFLQDKTESIDREKTVNELQVGSDETLIELVPLQLYDTTDNSVTEDIVFEKSVNYMLNVSDAAIVAAFSVGQEDTADTAIESIACNEDINELPNILGEGNDKIVTLGQDDTFDNTETSVNCIPNVSEESCVKVVSLGQGIVEMGIVGNNDTTDNALARTIVCEQCVNEVLNMLNESKSATDSPAQDYTKCCAVTESIVCVEPINEIQRLTEEANTATSFLKREGNTANTVIENIICNQNVFEIQDIAEEGCKLNDSLGSYDAVDKNIFCKQAVNDLHKFSVQANIDSAYHGQDHTSKYNVVTSESIYEDTNKTVVVAKDGCMMNVVEKETLFDEIDYSVANSNTNMHENVRGNNDRTNSIAKSGEDSLGNKADEKEPVCNEVVTLNSTCKQEEISLSAVQIISEDNKGLIVLNNYFSSQLTFDENPNFCSYPNTGTGYCAKCEEYERGRNEESSIEHYITEEDTVCWQPVTKPDILKPVETQLINKSSKIYEDQNFSNPSHLDGRGQLTALESTLKQDITTEFIAESKDTAELIFAEKYNHNSYEHCVTEADLLDQNGMNRNNRYSLRSTASDVICEEQILDQIATNIITLENEIPLIAAKEEIQNQYPTMHKPDCDKDDFSKNEPMGLIQEIDSNIEQTNASCLKYISDQMETENNEEIDIYIPGDISVVTAKTTTDVLANKSEFKILSCSMTTPKLMHVSKEYFSEQSDISAEEEAIVMPRREMDELKSDKDPYVGDENKHTFPARDLYLQFISDISSPANHTSSINQEESQLQRDCSAHIDNNSETLGDAIEAIESLTIKNENAVCREYVELSPEDYGGNLRGSLEQKRDIASKIKSFIFSEYDKYDIGLADSSKLNQIDYDGLTLKSFSYLEEDKYFETTSLSPEPGILSSTLLNNRQNLTGNESSMVKQLRQRFECPFPDVVGLEEQNSSLVNKTGITEIHGNDMLCTSDQSDIKHLIDSEYYCEENYKVNEKLEGENLLKDTHRQMLSLDSETLNNNLLSVEQELTDVLSIEDEELDRSIEKEIYDIEAMETPDAKYNHTYAFQERFGRNCIGNSEEFQGIEDEKLDVTIQEQIREIDEMQLLEGKNESNDFAFGNLTVGKKIIVQVDPSLLSFDPMDDEISSLEDEQIDEEMLTEISKVDSVAYNETEMNNLIASSKNCIKKVILPAVDLEPDENVEEEELDEEMQRVLEEVVGPRYCPANNVLMDDKIETSHSAIGFFSDCNKLDLSVSPCSPGVIDTYKIYDNEQLKLDHGAYDELSEYYNNDESFLEDTEEKDEYGAGEYMVEPDISKKDSTLLQHDMNNYEFFNSSKPNNKIQFILDYEQDYYDNVMSLAEPMLSSLQSETTGAGESLSESFQDSKDVQLSLSTESDSSDFHMWSSNVEFGEPGDVPTTQEGMDFDSIISAPNLDEALKKLERHIQDKGESFQWLSARTPSPSLQSLENCFKDGVPFFDTEEFYSQVSGGMIEGSALSSQDYSSNEIDDDIGKSDIWATPCENLPACTYVQGSVEANDLGPDSQEGQPQDWIISPYQYPRVIFGNTTQMSIIDEEEDSRKSEPSSPLQLKFTNNSTSDQVSSEVISASNDLVVQISLNIDNTHPKTNKTVENNSPMEKYNLPKVDFILNLNEKCNIEKPGSKDKLCLTNTMHIENVISHDNNISMENNQNKCTLIKEVIGTIPISVDDSGLKSSTLQKKESLQDETSHHEEYSMKNNLISNTDPEEKSQGDKNHETAIKNHSREMYVQERELFESQSCLWNVNTSSKNSNFVSEVDTHSEIQQSDTLQQPSINSLKEKKIREEIKHLLEYNIESVTEEIINDFSVSERKLYWDTKLQKIKDVEHQSTCSSGPKSLSRIKSGTVSKLVSCFGQTNDDEPGSPIQQNQAFIYPRTYSCYQTNNKTTIDKMYKEANYATNEEHKTEVPYKTESVGNDTNNQATASMKLVSHWKTYWDDMINEQSESNKSHPQTVHKIPSIQISEDDESFPQDDEISSNICNNITSRDNILFSASKVTETDLFPQQLDGNHLASVIQSSTRSRSPSAKDKMWDEATDDQNLSAEILSVPLMPRRRSYSTGNIHQEFLTNPTKSSEGENVSPRNKPQTVSSEGCVQHENDFKIRFERAKQFFKHLEQSGPGDVKGRDYRSMPRFNSNNKVRKPSVDSDSGPEAKVQIKREHLRGKKRRRKKEKDSSRIKSAPTSDTETSKRVNRQESGDSFGGSVKVKKVSERFHVKDLFRDVSDRDGLFRGIPNRAAVLASLRSVDDVRATQSVKADYSDLKSSASLGNIPSGFQEEYPYLPTTPIHRFRPRSALGLNLIPRSELLDENF